MQSPNANNQEISNLLYGEGNNDIIAFSSYLIANIDLDLNQVTEQVIDYMKMDLPISQIETLIEAYTKYQKVDLLQDVSLMESFLSLLILKVKESKNAGKVLAECVDTMLLRGDATIIIVALINIITLADNQGKIIIIKAFNKLYKRIAVVSIDKVLLAVDAYISNANASEECNKIISSLISECVKLRRDQIFEDIAKLHISDVLLNWIEESLFAKTPEFMEIKKNFKNMSMQDIIVKLREYKQQNPDFEVETAIKFCTGQIAKQLKMEFNKSHEVDEKRPINASVISAPLVSAPSSKPSSSFDSAHTKDFIEVLKEKYLKVDTANSKDTNARFRELSDEIMKLKSNGVL